MLPFAGRDLLVIVAHPDDEVLFAGAQFASCGRLRILHVTDGATSHRAARAQGFPNRRAYAEARRDELRAALATGGITADCVSLGYPDQTASYRMGEIASHILAELARDPPELVLTHAYEGGHLDHDATCFAVHEAVRRSGRAFPIWEFAGYHVQNGSHVRNRFPRDGHPPGVTVHLDAEQRARKAAMLYCFATQKDIVAQFSVGSESFRLAPDQDFGRPPFAGLLGFEIDPTRPEGRFWRELAQTERAAADRPHGFIDQRRIGRLRLWLAFKVSRLRRRFSGGVRSGK